MGLPIISLFSAMGLALCAAVGTILPTNDALAGQRRPAAIYKPERELEEMLDLARTNMGIVIPAEKMPKLYEVYREIMTRLEAAYREHTGQTLEIKFFLVDSDEINAVTVLSPKAQNPRRAYYFANVGFIDAMSRVAPGSEERQWEKAFNSLIPGIMQHEVGHTVVGTDILSPARQSRNHFNQHEEIRADIEGARLGRKARFKDTNLFESFEHLKRFEKQDQERRLRLSGNKPRVQTLTESSNLFATLFSSHPPTSLRASQNRLIVTYDRYNWGLYHVLPLNTVTPAAIETIATEVAAAPSLKRRDDRLLRENTAIGQIESQEEAIPENTEQLQLTISAVETSLQRFSQTAGTILPRQLNILYGALAHIDPTPAQCLSLQNLQWQLFLKQFQRSGKPMVLPASFQQAKYFQSAGYLRLTAEKIREFLNNPAMHRSTKATVLTEAADYLIPRQHFITATRPLLLELKRESGVHETFNLLAFHASENTDAFNEFLLSEILPTASDGELAAMAIAMKFPVLGTTPRDQPWRRLFRAHAGPLLLGGLISGQIPFYANHLDELAADLGVARPELIQKVRDLVEAEIKRPDGNNTYSEAFINTFKACPEWRESGDELSIVETQSLETFMKREHKASPENGELFGPNWNIDSRFQAGKNYSFLRDIISYSIYKLNPQLLARHYRMELLRLLNKKGASIFSANSSDSRAVSNLMYDALDNTVGKASLTRYSDLSHHTSAAQFIEALSEVTTLGPELRARFARAILESHFRDKQQNLDIESERMANSYLFNTMFRLGYLDRPSQIAAFLCKPEMGGRDRFDTLLEFLPALKEELTAIVNSSALQQEKVRNFLRFANAIFPTSMDYRRVLHLKSDFVNQMREALLLASQQLQMTAYQKFELFLNLTAPTTSVQLDEYFKSDIQPHLFNVELSTYESNRPKLKRVLEEHHLRGRDLIFSLVEQYLEPEIVELEQRPVLEMGSLDQLVDKIDSFYAFESERKDELLEGIAWRLHISNLGLLSTIEGVKSTNWRRTHAMTAHLASFGFDYLGYLSRDQRLRFIRWLTDLYRGPLPQDIQVRLKDILIAEIHAEGPGRSRALQLLTGEGEIKSSSAALDSGFLLFIDNMERAAANLRPEERVPIVDFILETSSQPLNAESTFPYNVTRELTSYAENSRSERVLRAFVNSAHSPEEIPPSISFLLAMQNQPGARGLKPIFEMFKVLGQKLAQTSSTLNIFDDEEVSQDLSTSKDRTKPMTRSEIFSILNDPQVVSANIRSRIENIGDLLGSASVKTVFEAVLRNGRTVVMMIARPFAAEQFQLNLQRARRFLNELENEHVDFPVDVMRIMLDGIEETMPLELDFTKEAEIITEMGQVYNRINESMASESHGWSLKVPQLLNAFPVTKQYMFQEKASGVNYDLLPAGAMKDHAGFLIVKSSLKLLFENGLMEPDRHKGNFLIDEENKTIWIYDFPQLRRLSVESANGNRSEVYNLSQFLRALDSRAIEALVEFGSRLTNDHAALEPANRRRIKNSIAEILRKIPADKALPRDALAAVIKAFAQAGHPLSSRVAFGVLKGLLTLKGENYVSEAVFKELLSQNVQTTLMQNAEATMADQNFFDIPNEQAAGITDNCATGTGASEIIATAAAKVKRKRVAPAPPQNTGGDPTPTPAGPRRRRTPSSTTTLERFNSCELLVLNITDRTPPSQTKFEDLRTMILHRVRGEDFMSPTTRKAYENYCSTGLNPTAVSALNESLRADLARSAGFSASDFPAELTLTELVSDIEQARLLNQAHAPHDTTPSVPSQQQATAPEQWTNLPRIADRSPSLSVLRELYPDIFNDLILIESRAHHRTTLNEEARLQVALGLTQAMRSFNNEWSPAVAAALMDAIKNDLQQRHCLAPNAGH